MAISRPSASRIARASFANQVQDPSGFLKRNSLRTEFAFPVRRVKAALFQWVQVPPGNRSNPEATGAVMEVTKWLKPSISVSRIGDSASVQAATRVNAEQSSKRTMRRPTRQPFRGRLTRLDEDKAKAAARVVDPEASVAAPQRYFRFRGNLGSAGHATCSS